MEPVPAWRWPPRAPFPKPAFSHGRLRIHTYFMAMKHLLSSPSPFCHHLTPIRTCLSASLVRYTRLSLLRSCRPGALPDETGRVWLTPPGPCLSRLLPKLRCSSDIAQTLVLCLTPERCDFLCVGFTVSRGFSEVTDSALTTFPSPSPRAHGRMSVYTFLVPLPGPVRMTSERTVQLAGTWVPCAVCSYCSPGSA